MRTYRYALVSSYQNIACPLSTSYCHKLTPHILRIHYVELQTYVYLLMLILCSRQRTLTSNCSGLCSMNYPICYLPMHTDNCNHGEVRSPLLGGASESEGLVEVCVEGNYLPVSLDNGRFSVREATVICKQLGLGNGESNCKHA